MTSTLEKIARAIGSVPIGYDEADEFVSVPTDAREAIARAALLAMREPDRDMIIAGNDEDGYHNDGSEFTAECSTHWRAMIDAILKEGE